MFLGVMTKHQRVQIVPVATRARFWVRESFSAGRARSEMPAMTRDHCIIYISELIHVDINQACGG